MRNRTVLVASMLVLASFLTPKTTSAVGGKNAEYVGGTVGGLKEGVEGRLDTSTEKAAVFEAEKGIHVEIPYDQITELEYGQKAGRRVAVAVMISPLALFSKKRNHFLTITYKDSSGKEQAGVFELGKDVVRTTLKIMQTRSGKEIKYQDDEARKSGMAGGK